MQLVASGLQKADAETVANIIFEPNVFQRRTNAEINISQVVNDSRLSK